MTLVPESRHLTQLREIVAAGPPPQRSRTPLAPLRRAARTLLLRVLRPYTSYQHQVDVRIAALLAEQDARWRAQGQQLERVQALIADLVATAEEVRRNVVDQSRVLTEFEQVRSELQALPYMADQPFERFHAAVGEVTGYRSPLVPNADSPYSAFEDLFRGPPERVVELQRPYLPLVREHQPVLDIGCGRGDFLTMLRSEGIAGSGVDSDRGMIRQCEQRGVQAVLADANEHLRSLPDATLGTVFSAQVIEHLPVDALRELLALARQKLRPDGILIAETVNPHSIPAMKTFWVDLTHQHPIFPEVALALCSISGFRSGYVFGPGHDDFERVRFTSTSYAVVASVS